ncbi:hypothetical protein Cni_G15158 [Canna indica]|uniref:Uncharacterized protein n=1 Tax=Canna indica TaxID=4628 RepID=A0AAQ3KE04_9LILI|nr:hypothetical protein Cni_G15158 [Canna indica]
MKRLPYLCLLSKTLDFIHRPRNRDAGLLVFAASYCDAATNSRDAQRLFVAEYLVSSRGFAPKKAAEASKLLRNITDREQPDSVVGFFKRYGFDDADTKKLISWNPQWLLLDAEKTLAPKFRAFEDLGFSQSDVIHLVRSNPVVINHKLGSVISKIQFWMDLLGSRDILVKTFKANQWILGNSIQKRIQPNIEVLRECGIADRKLATILRWHPRMILQKTDTFKSLISRAEGLGVPRTSGMFHWTVWVLYIVGVERFKKHMEFLMSYWSEAEFLAAFRRSPTFMTHSLMDLQNKMEFLVNEAECPPSYIAHHPTFLTLSLENRLIPRYQILKALKSRGIIVGNNKLSTYMAYPEKKFLENYVLRYKDECPDLVQSYNTRLKCSAAL